MVQLDWYRSFLAVYRTGTVSRAAQTRFLTQPAVSQHIAALESAVGEALFLRTPRRMVPTEASKRLYARVAGSIDSLDHVSVTLRADSIQQRPRATIGAPAEYFTEVVLSQLGADLDLTLDFGITENLLPRLEQGKLHAVIATQHTAVRGIRYENLGEEEFVLVASEKYDTPVNLSLSRENLRVVANWLSSQRWISYGVELPIIRRYWQSVFKTRPPFSAAVVAPDLRAVKKAVLLGYGISVLPAYLCREEFDRGYLRVLLKPRQTVRNDLWLGYRKTSESDPIIGLLRRLLCHKGADE